MNRCPKCASIAVSHREPQDLWGQRFERRVCLHCGTGYRIRVGESQEDATAPEENPTRHVEPSATVYRKAGAICPQCQSDNTIVTSTRAELRHHKCRACEHCFKTGR